MRRSRRRRVAGTKIEQAGGEKNNPACLRSRAVPKVEKIRSDFLMEGGTISSSMTANSLESAAAYSA